MTKRLKARTIKLSKPIKFEVSELPFLDLIDENAESEITESIISQSKLLVRNKKKTWDGIYPRYEVTRKSMDELQWHLKRLEVVKKHKSNEGKND